MREEYQFNHALMTAIEMGLTKLYSRDDAEGIKFLADPRMALGSGRAFAAVIEKMFGANAQKVLKSIEDSLCQIAGIPQKDWGSFEECVEAARETIATL